MNDIQSISLFIVMLCGVVLILLINRMQKKKKGLIKEKCDICGNSFTFGGSFNVDGKIVCVRCEKNLRNEKDEEKNKIHYTNMEGVDNQNALLLEKMDYLITLQKYSNKYIKNISDIVTFFFILSIIGFFLILVLG